MSLLIAYRFYSSRRWFPFCDYCRLNGRMMNAALIFDECDRDQNKYYDEHHALFVLREFENPEQTFHSVWHSVGIRYVARLTTSMIVMLSEAKHL